MDNALLNNRKLYSINDLTPWKHGDLDLLVKIQVDILSLIHPI